MATLTELSNTVADAENMDRERVGAIARAIREAGLIATGGRGLSAARMTEVDAANLLIAVNIAPIAREAPAVVGLYRRLMQRPDITGTFGQELEGLLAAARDEALQGQIARIANRDGDKKAIRYAQRVATSRASFTIRVALERPIPIARIEVTFQLAGSFAAMAALRFKHDPASGGTPVSDREERVTFSDYTLRAVGAALRR